MLPLTSGAKCVVGSSAAQKDPFTLKLLIESHPEITHMQATPVTYDMLYICGYRGRKDMVALCGGEPFRKSLLRLKFERWVNVYGPTETCVWQVTGLLLFTNDAHKTTVPVSNCDRAARALFVLLCVCGA